MQSKTLDRNDQDTPAAGESAGWLAFALVTSSYFAVLMGLITYTVLKPW